MISVEFKSVLFFCDGWEPKGSKGPAFRNYETRKIRETNLMPININIAYDHSK